MANRMTPLRADVVLLADDGTIFRARRPLAARAIETATASATGANAVAPAAPAAPGRFFLLPPMERRRDWRRRRRR